MTDYLVSALVKTIIGALASASLQEIGLLWGLKDELDRLETTFTTLQLVLADAEIKQRKSQPIQNWLRKLKDVAYDAENVLDEMATETHKRKVESEIGNSFFCFRNPLKFQLQMAHKLKCIREKISEISSQRLEFHLGEGVMENRFGVTLESRQTSSLVNEVEIYGREEEKERMIKRLLLDRSHQDDLSVYAICGMGGLGKTTLAQLVFNDERIDRNFELRIWVCVSDDFSIHRLVRAIIESIDQGRRCNISDQLDPLQRNLQERLRGKRFLLVLDDVWNENHLLWDGLKEILGRDSRGSVVVATTRIEKVALMMATVDVQRIGCLNEEHSWSLFKLRAFPTEKASGSFVALGREIVKKCGGVPMAIKALGSLMRFKSSEGEWLAIKESEIWELSDDENGILPALRLSYDNLLPHVRQCFAYCCLYPKDSKMPEYELIQLWMANGFIPSDDQRDLFLTGRMIFKELTWRSFFQDVQTDSGKTSCKMHDLMHDLAVSVMRHETFIFEPESLQKIPKMVRHLSLGLIPHGCPAIENKFKLKFDGSLRTFFMRRQSTFQRVSLYSFLSKQHYIRALQVSESWIKNCQNLVCKMEQLRYLCISCSSLKRLPESLTQLYNLQTLKLWDSEQLVELPKDMKVIKNLWFLEIENFESLQYMPSGLGELTYLCRLPIFIVDQGGSRQIDQLKQLNLCGELTIKGLNNVTHLEGAKSANLVRKTNLTYLCLCWTRDHMYDTSEQFEVLQGLQPHQNLEKLRIECYQGSKFPDWMSNFAFKNLEDISLMSSPRCKHLPAFGKLPSLRRLYLHEMDSVKSLGAEWYGDSECSFPALTDLELWKMPNLEEWCLPDSIKSFPCLCFLRIKLCPKLDALPLLHNFMDLSICESHAGLISSVMNLPSVKSLELDIEFDGLPSDSVQRGMTLQQLRIRGSGMKTRCGILDRLSSLKVLHFFKCPNLEFVPDEIRCLNFLERLGFSYCDALTSFSTTVLEDLSSLTTLVLHICKKLKPFSGPLNGDAVLDRLVISGLPEFDCFPESIRQFESLSELRIMNCEKLRSLPRDLRSLEKLYVVDCPQLKERCKKAEGKEWPKISHIPFIDIDGEIIQSLNRQ